ncbi:MAG: hypothetical protein AB1442_03265 [Nitrospirota bacterium]
MKRLVIAAIGFVLLAAGAPSVQSQTQEVEGYTLVRSTSGTAVCLGRWVQPRDVALPGYCEGNLMDISQFAAISSRLTADKLDQVILALSSLDQKLAVNNEQIRQLIDVNSKTQTSIDLQVTQVGDIINEAITRRFDELPAEILSNELFKAEMEKLKSDILSEVQKHYVRQPAPSAK